ncbi:MAG: response regulator receiver protein [Candidatus Angelobacter sp.]|nr:response regulator receiver protein [Candidatus Angelobacter sp.]
MYDKGFLNSWKEVAQYVGRSERTIQRWEREFGFPVHRPAGKLRSSVIAVAAEIDEWIRKSPALRSQLQSRPTAMPGDQLPETSSANAPLVLCIEEDGQGLSFRKAFLETKGYRVLATGDSREGVTLFENNRISLVILGCGACELDGEVLARMLKRRNPNVPIVMCSGAEELPQRVRQLADRVVTSAQGADVLLSAVQKSVRGANKFVPGPPNGHVTAQ